MLAISKDIPSFPVHVRSNLEIIFCSLAVGHQTYIVGVCYRPPCSSPTFVNELHGVLNIINTRFPSCPLFLFGDFNFPNIK